VAVACSPFFGTTRQKRPPISTGLFYFIDEVLVGASERRKHPQQRIKMDKIKILTLLTIFKSARGGGP